jgi:tRNA (guanine37-N1)-methyltransferase
MKKFLILTLFPEMFEKILGGSMMWKAQDRGLASFELLNFREFGIGAHKSVDDTPYGGGDGMLLRVDVLAAALDFAKNPANFDGNFTNAKVIMLSPSETVWSQTMAETFARTEGNHILICGHYEGFDARIEKFIDAKISIGKFVLTGGELPAMILIDSVVRLIPGVLGGEKSAEIESYSDGDNLEFPQFTRPESFRGDKVPPVLLSGNHAEIAKWRADNSR